jgi:hypothetical protein
MPEQVEELPDSEIIDRWCCLFKGPTIVQQYLQGQALNSLEKATVSDIVAVWRKRLANISWFMRCHNQNIARQTNIEDEYTGKFWECRYHSQALKTEEPLISCMAYVNLNPVRPRLADTPEASEYTSIQERINPRFCLKSAISDQTEKTDLIEFKQALKSLLHFEESIRNDQQNGILFSYIEHLQLVDWTDRAIRDDKRGHIINETPPILARLNVSSKQWLINTTQFESINRSRFNRSRFNRIEPTFNTG